MRVAVAGRGCRSRDAGCEMRVASSEMRLPNVEGLGNSMAYLCNSSVLSGIDVIFGNGACLG